MIEILPNWHPIFVHFSVALLTVSVVLFVLSKVITNWRVEDQLIATAYWNLWIGTAVSIGTVIAGWVAFDSVDHDTPSHVVMLEHRTWAFATFGAMVVLSIWAVLQYRAQKAPTWLFLISLLVMQSLVLGTAWHGGELVYAHGLGVKRLPDPDEHKHAPGTAHSHGAEGGGHDHGATGSDHHKDMGGGDPGHGAAPAGMDHHQDGVVGDHHQEAEGVTAAHPHDGVDAAHHHDEPAAVVAPEAPPVATEDAATPPPEEPAATPADDTGHAP